MVVQSKDPLQVLQALKDGNLRYRARLKDDNSVSTRAPVLQQEHNPVAVILGCSDARVPVEIVFDQGLGDLFVIRVAGNVVTPSQIGSVEFAVEKFHTKLVVVLGHSHCGAVTACVEGLISPEAYHSPNLQSIIDRIRPSVYNLHEISTAAGQEVEVDAFIEHAIRANVRLSVSQLKYGSRYLEDMARSGEIMIVGAEYDLATGKVLFLDDEAP